MTETGDVRVTMSMEALIAVEERIRGAFIEQAQAFLEILDDQLYLAAEYPTFDQYCDERLNCGANYGRRMAKAGRLVNNLLIVPIGQKWLPANERQARELARLPEEQQEAAAQVIVDLDLKKAGEPQITAESIKDTLLQQKFFKPRKKITDEERQRRVDQGNIRELRDSIDKIAAMPWSGRHFIEKFGYAQLGEKAPFALGWLEEAEATQQARFGRRSAPKSGP